MKKTLISNSGFSLVEVLISITVLCIITIPIASVFFSSARLVNNSSTTYNATITAKNIINELQITKLNDWFLNEQNIKLNIGAQNNEILGKVVSPVNNNGYNEYVSTGGTFNQYSDIHYIEFKGLNTHSEILNAVITLDSGEENQIYEEINSTQIFNNAQANYIAAQTRQPTQDPDSISRRAFILKCAQVGYEIISEEAFLSRVSVDRTITLDIEQSDDKQNMNATLLYTYSFVFPTPTASEKIDTSVVGTQYIWPENLQDNKIFLTPESGVNLPQNNGEKYPNLFVVFYPFYANKDEIIINNKNNLPIEITLAKQRDELLSDSELAMNEIKYNAAVIVNETNTQIMQATIKTNINSNLSNTSSISLPVLFLFNSKSFAPQNLVQKTAEDRIYTVIIELFNADENGNSIYSKGPIYTVKTTNLQ